MKQLYLKISLLLLFVTHFIIVHGQGSMYVHNLDGKHQKFTVSDIDKLTFPGENMLVAFKSTALKNYSIPEIKFCNFKEMPDWDGDRPLYAIRVFPNPTNNDFSIKSTVEITEIILYNILGQKLKQVIPDSDIIHLQLDNYSRGVYLLQIMTPEGILSEKIIKD